jgi:hypothetical protein
VPDPDTDGVRVPDVVADTDMLALSDTVGVTEGVIEGEVE